MNMRKLPQGKLLISLLGNGWMPILKGYLYALIFPFFFLLLTGFDLNSFSFGIHNSLFEGQSERIYPIILNGDSICLDTVKVSIPFETTSEICLPDSVFQIQGTISSAAFCNRGNLNTVFASLLNGKCVTLIPSSGYSGLSPDLICVVHCFNNDLGQCDTTFMEITVDAGGGCPEYFGADTITVVSVVNPVEVCLPLPLSQAVDLQLFLNGSSYLLPLSGCMPTTIVGYGFSLLIGGGFNGPYSVDSWTCNTGTFSGFINDLNDLVVLMNFWDPAGNWVLDAATASIFGGEPGGTYGDMAITHIITNSPALISTDNSIIFNGTSIQLDGVGLHQFVVVDSATQCSDTLIIDVLGENETLNIVTTENTQSSLLCLDTLNFPTNFDSLAVCTPPQNGTIFINENCFSYLPESGFTGMDSACLVVCDLLANCDTTFLKITVNPLFCSEFDFLPNGLVDLTVDDCAAGATFCLPVSLDTLASMTIIDNGLPYDGGFVSCGIDSTQIVIDTGFHRLVFTEANAICSDTLLAEISCLIDTIPPFCTGFDFLPNGILNLESSSCDAGFSLCLRVPLDSIANFTILDNGLPYAGGFSNCGIDSTQIVVDTGFHRLIFIENNAVCSDTLIAAVSCVMDTIPPICNGFDYLPNEQINLTADDCNQGVALCLPVSVDTINSSITILDNGFPYEGGLEFCGVDSTLISIDTGFHELVFISIHDGCSDTLFAEINCLPDTLPLPCGIKALSPDTFNLLDCESAAFFCVDILHTNFTNFVVEDNGLPFAGNAGTCNQSFTRLELQPGFHRLLFKDTIKMCTDTFDVLVNCFDLADLVIDTTVRIDDSLNICLEDLSFDLTAIDSLTNSCPNQSEGNVTFVLDSNAFCLSVLPQNEGFDTLCIQVFVADTFVTVFVNVAVLPLCMDLIGEEIIGTGATDCINEEGMLCLPVNLEDLENVAIEINGQPYEGGFFNCGVDSNFIFAYTSLPGNGNLGPYLINSWTINGIVFSGLFENPQELADSMNIWDPSGAWEIVEGDMNIFVVGGDSGNEYGQFIITDTSTGITVEQSLNTNIFPKGVGITIPVGTWPLTFTDTLTGCVDAISATLVCLETASIFKTVEVGETDTLCLTANELPGTLNDIFNACLSSSGEFVEFEILNDTCITYTGLVPGGGRACFVLCDDLGVCDTFFVFVETLVPLIDRLPIAVNDTATAGLNQPLRLNILGNDTFLLLTEFFILKPPINGIATFLPDKTVNYVPNSEYCDDLVPDSFSYVICNDIRCDTATVFITVECSELEIFNGFSPNGDGMNDFFVIQGIQAFPNNKLMIFNRWGNRVFEAVNYQNDWDGKWDGNDLPDGTYFYLLEFGNGETQKGFVQLNR